VSSSLSVLTELEALRQPYQQFQQQYKDYIATIERLRKNTAVFKNTDGKGKAYHLPITLLDEQPYEKRTSPRPVIDLTTSSERVRDDSNISANYHQSPVKSSPETSILSLSHAPPTINS
jgi:hypothetical protein